MGTADRLQAAHAAAQAAFRAMLDAECYSDPSAPETKAYVQAERLVDSILVDAQWETSKAGLDAQIAADADWLLR